MIGTRSNSHKRDDGISTIDVDWALCKNRGSEIHPKQPGELEHRKGRPRETWVGLDKDDFEGKGN
jgi:hypothetical protein